MNTGWWSLFKPLRTFLDMPNRHKALVVESLWELAIARFLVRFGTFEKWKSRMGRAIATPNGAPRPNPVDPAIEAQCAELGKVLRKVARNVPFKANCLPQASAAQVMLKRRGIHCGKVFIGGKRGTKGDPLDLHAWLFAGSVCVTGNDGPGSLQAFKPLVMFSLDNDHGE